MGVHDDGLGSNWREDSPDKDQPQGLDWQEMQGLKKAIRKRFGKGHADFSDSTIGGEHTPGCGVLGMEITSDPTAQVVSGSSDEYRGHGMVWSCDGSAGTKGKLYCSTAAADSTSSGTWREILLHPDQVWGGKDITWTGAHQFDASVEMTTGSVFGDMSVLGHLYCGSNWDITGSMYVDGSSDVTAVYFAGDVTFGSGIHVDGTTLLQETDISGSLDVSGTISVSDMVSMIRGWDTDVWNWTYYSDQNDGPILNDVADLFVSVRTNYNHTMDIRCSSSVATIYDTTNRILHTGKQNTPSSYAQDVLSANFPVPKDFYFYMYIYASNTNRHTTNLNIRCFHSQAFGL